MKKMLIFFAVLFCFVQNVQAQDKPDVTLNKGVFKPRPIAISRFHFEDPAHQRLANEIPAIVERNLESSGLFRPVNPNSFAQAPSSITKEGLRFPEWRATGAETIVTGQVMNDEQGRTRVEFKLWDAFSHQMLTGKIFTTTPANWRRIAHIISDEVYSRLTGEEGYFDTRIVYISETGPSNKRVKRLAIMDQDGANHKYLTDGSYLVLTPRFSPETQRLTYISYQSGKPHVYLYDINSGSHRLLGSFPGMTFAPRFSPDGRKVIMSMAKGGNTDIYVMDLNSKRPQKITSGPSIETGASYAPDGKKIVFESDRSGTQQLYTMNADGSGAQRITFGEGRYGNPVWSPRGDLIAFTRMYKGKFYIGVIRPDGKGERMITSAYHVEGPTWSPNGRVLSYFKETPDKKGRERSAKLYTVDITGYNERVLKTPKHGSDPAWSPINP